MPYGPEAILPPPPPEKPLRELVVEWLEKKQDVISDLAQIRANALLAYRKPADGIPMDDLSQDVQDAIEHAGEVTMEDITLHRLQTGDWELSATVAGDPQEVPGNWRVQWDATEEGWQVWQHPTSSHDQTPVQRIEMFETKGGPYSTRLEWSTLLPSGHAMELKAVRTDPGNRLGPAYGVNADKPLAAADALKKISDPSLGEVAAALGWTENG